MCDILQSMIAALYGVGGLSFQVTSTNTPSVVHLDLVQRCTLQSVQNFFVLKPNHEYQGLVSENSRVDISLQHTKLCIQITIVRSNWSSVESL